MAPLTSTDLSVIICTRERPVEVREALAAVEAQTHPGTIETVVVFDQSAPDQTLGREGGTRPVRVVTNRRMPGLPGARNTGAEEARGAVLAFCDDDDLWLPAKAERQLAVLARNPGLDVVASGVRIETGEATVDRVPTRDEVTLEMLLASRVAEAHISTVVVRRDAFFERIGFVNEVIPGGYAEDYEWMLRAARQRPIAIVREPLVRVRWHPGSFFASRWRTIDEALGYLVDAFPELASVPRGLARIEGQRAFARAASGQAGAVWPMIRRTLRLDWREPRAYLAALVALRLVSADRLVRALNRHGRGI